MEVFFHHEQDKTSSTTINPLNLFVSSNDNHSSSYLDQHNMPLTSPLQLMSTDEDQSYLPAIPVEEEGEDEIDVEEELKSYEDQIDTQTQGQVNLVELQKGEEEGLIQKKSEEVERKKKLKGKGKEKVKKTRGKSKTGAYVASNLAPLPEDSIARYPLPAWSTVEPGQRVIHPPPYAFSSPTMAQSTKSRQNLLNLEDRDEDELEENDEKGKDNNKDGDEEAMEMKEEQKQPQYVVNTNIIAPLTFWDQAVQPAQPVQFVQSVQPIGSAQPLKTVQNNVQPDTPQTPLTAISTPMQSIQSVQYTQYPLFDQSYLSFQSVPSMPAYQPYIPNQFIQFNQSNKHDQYDQQNQYNQYDRYDQYNQVNQVNQINQINQYKQPDQYQSPLISPLSTPPPTAKYRHNKRTISSNRRRSSLKPKGSKQRLIEDKRRHSVPNLSRKKSHEKVIASGQRTSYYLDQNIIDTPQLSASSSIDMRGQVSIPSFTSIDHNCFNTISMPSTPYISNPYLYPPPLSADSFLTHYYPSQQPSQPPQPSQQSQTQPLQHSFQMIQGSQANLNLIDEIYQPLPSHHSSYNIPQEQSIPEMLNPKTSRQNKKSKGLSKSSNSVSERENRKLLKAHDVPLWALNDPKVPIVRPYGLRKGDRPPWKAILDEERMRMKIAKEEEEMKKYVEWIGEDGMDEEGKNEVGDESKGEGGRVDESESIQSYNGNGLYSLENTFPKPSYEQYPRISINNNSLPPSLVVSATSSSTSSSTSLSPTQSLFDYNNKSIPSITVTHFETQYSQTSQHSQDLKHSQKRGKDIEMGISPSVEGMEGMEGMMVGDIVDIGAYDYSHSISEHQFWRKRTIDQNGPESFVSSMNTDNSQKLGELQGN